tara:strand:- start:932 stop:1222 length:291 start_codon:yes stop_codon:yes gene_type:complete
LFRGLTCSDGDKCISIANFDCVQSRDGDIELGVRFENYAIILKINNKKLWIGQASPARRDRTNDSRVPLVDKDDILNHAGRTDYFSDPSFVFDDLD